MNESSVEKTFVFECLRVWKADPADCNNTMDKIQKEKSFFLYVEIGLLLPLKFLVMVRNTVERTETCEIDQKFILFHNQIRYFSCLIIPFLLIRVEELKIYFIPWINLQCRHMKRIKGDRG